MSFTKQQNIEIVGLTAVVVSLIFVGMQLYFDRQVAIVDQYHKNAEASMSNLRSYMESEPYMNMIAMRWEDGNRPGWWNEEFEANKPKNYSAIDIQTLLMSRNLDMFHYDNMYFQYKQGFMNEDVWLTVRQFIKGDLNGSWIRMIYRYNSPSRQFQEFVNDLIIEYDTQR